MVVLKERKKRERERDSLVKWKSEPSSEPVLYNSRREKREAVREAYIEKIGWQYKER